MAISFRSPLHDPEVSVIIPAYNAAADIGDALASVFEQTATNCEVILVNDGSPDTPTLERAIAPFTSRLRYIVQPNAGAAGARNSGILASRAPCLAFLDADDRWAPTFLASQLTYLRQHPACALVYADARISGETPLAGRTFMATTPSSGDVTVASLLAQRCTVLTSTVVLRRDWLRRAGLFNPAIRRGHDFDLWVRIAFAGGRIEYQRRVLAERRVRCSGLSGDPLHELDRARSVYLHLAQTLPLGVREREALRGRLMWIIDRRDVERARASLAKGDVERAQQHLVSVARPDHKVRMLRAVIRVAPTLVRKVAVASGRLTLDRPLSDHPAPHGAHA
jgi:glycosyltransferase involved in cell wall biosynthesis